MDFIVIFLNFNFLFLLMQKLKEKVSQALQFKPYTALLPVNAIHD